MLVSGLRADVKRPGRSFPAGLLHPLQRPGLARLRSTLLHALVLHDEFGEHIPTLVPRFQARQRVGGSQDGSVMAPESPPLLLHKERRRRKFCKGVWFRRPNDLAPLTNIAVRYSIPNNGQISKELIRALKAWLNKPITVS